MTNTIPETKQVTEEYPWLMPDVIRWLEETLRGYWTVLETGMGGSTVFFAQRVEKVISFEHDPRWFDKVKRVIDGRGLKNVDARFRAAYPKAGLDDDLPGIDLAFIDGRGRVRSVIDAMPRVVVGGFLILDDSDRPRYQEAFLAMERSGWTMDRQFDDHFNQTTVWRKP